MKTNHYLISTVMFMITGTLFLTSCQKSNFEDHLGKSVCATSGFQFIEQPAVSNSTIDLNTQSQLLTATFNEEVPWSVVIRGTISKSFKKFSGYGMNINLSWKGNPDTTVFFQTELCTVEFKVACKDPVVESFSISNANDFSHFGYLAFDGDGNGLLAPSTHGDFQTHAIAAGMNSPQGGNCYCMTGNAPQPEWYFGGVEFRPTSLSTLNEDPSTVYINCFINVQGSTTSAPTISLYENGRRRDKTVLISGMGWHYLSYKLSDFNLLNPRNINAIVVGLGGYPDRSMEGKMCIDFISFTNDAPFITSK